MKLPDQCWLTLKNTAQKSNLSDSNMTNLTWGFESLVSCDSEHLKTDVGHNVYNFSLCYHQISLNLWVLQGLPCCAIMYLLYNYEIFVL